MITIISPTRVTLALDIIKRIDDGPLTGYHELGIIKHQIALADVIHIEHIDRHNGHDTVECDDPRVPVDGDNICVKACEVVRKMFGRRDFLRIVIEKNIPVMGGMAGGSANAAAMLRGLDELWGLGLTVDQYRELGRSLGMDVPFFFDGKTAFDSEAGGVIEPINTNLKFHIILAIPDFGVSTKEAYGGIDYGCIGRDILSTNKMKESLLSDDLESTIKNMHNDFELSIFNRHPQLRKIRDDLLKAGCLSACMTGSGSTIIGIATNQHSAEKIAGCIDGCRTIVTASYQPL
jgi:4-diphosphocytidyl-2-C-methyl-D-erythritol kinase